MTLSTQPKPQPKPQPQPLRPLWQRDADAGAMNRPSIQRSRADAVHSNGDFRVGRCSWGRANAATIEAGAGEGAGMGKSTTGGALPSSQQTQRHPSMPTHRRLFACLAPFLLAAGVSEAFATPLGLPSDPTAPLRGGADAAAAAARPAALSRPIFAATATSSAAQISLSPDEETSAASDEGDAESLPSSSSSSSSYRRKIGKHEQPKAQRPTYRRRHELEIEHLEIPLSPPLPSSSSSSSLSKDGANGVFVVGGAGDEDEGGNSDYAAGNDKSTFLPSSVLDSAGTLPVEYVAETNLPTDVGHFRLRAYRIPAAALKSRKIRSALLRSGMGTEPCVIYCTDKPPFGLKGGGGGRDSSDTIKPAEDVPVRIHDQCFTSEVFRSQRCDCKEQLVMALKYIQENGGAIIYLQQEGRGIGLANKVAAYALQDAGMDTVDANIHLGFPEDCRQYGVVPSILEDMGIRSIRLMTNNPRKLERMRALGVNVADTVPMVVERANAYNRKYLETKRERMNHANFGDMLSRTLRPVAATEASTNGMMASRRVTSRSVAESSMKEGEE